MTLWCIRRIIDGGVTIKPPGTINSRPERRRADGLYTITIMFRRFIIIVASCRVCAGRFD